MQGTFPFPLDYYAVQCTISSTTTVQRPQSMGKARASVKSRDWRGKDQTPMLSTPCADNSFPEPLSSHHHNPSRLFERLDPSLPAKEASVRWTSMGFERLDCDEVSLGPGSVRFPLQGMEV